MQRVVLWKGHFKLFFFSLSLLKYYLTLTFPSQKRTCTRRCDDDSIAFHIFFFHILRRRLCLITKFQLDIAAHVWFIIIYFFFFALNKILTLIFHFHLLLLIIFRIIFFEVDCRERKLILMLETATARDS